MTDTDQGVGTVDTENTQGADTAAVENGQGADTAAVENGQGAEATAEAAQKDGQQPETMTKEEAVKMANGMLARKLKGMPSKEELSAFKQWKASQKTEADKQADQEQEKLQELREKEQLAARLEEYKRKDQAIASGVLPKYAGYAAYMAGKSVMEDTDFDTALSAFLENNPEYKQPPKSTGMRQGKSNASGHSGGNMVDIIKAEQPKRN